MLPTLIQTLSAERFGTYLKAAGHDPHRALRLYVWNAQIGGAFHTPIQAVEIALRNGVNKALIARFGPDWWRHRRLLEILDRERQADLAIVIKRIRKRQLALVTGQIVAGLSFGFWTGMLQRRYNPEIWGAQLRAAFPHLPITEDRDALFRLASGVAVLRNRISHHEPIFKRDLSNDFATVMRLLKWICPWTHEWIRPHCHAPELMRSKP